MSENFVFLRVWRFGVTGISELVSVSENWIKFDERPVALPLLVVFMTGVSFFFVLAV
jgi:hypothetical protein